VPPGTAASPEPQPPVVGRANRYSVFGGVLDSDLDFPELRPAADDAPASWRLRTSDHAAPPSEGRLLGEEEFPLYGSALRLSRLDDGFRLAYSDSGTFDVSADGAEIVWYRERDARMEIVRMDVIGRVLATALHATGALALHASAVEIDGWGIGFLAPKFYGKSTLALALTYAGARLITDDTLGVMPGDPAMCIPGVHSVRLRAESAARFAGGQEPTESTGGRVVSELPDSKLMADRVPLAALYLLSPVNPESATEPVQRVPVPSFQGTIAALGHAKMGGLFRESEAATNFERAAAITRTVPVYQLALVRDLAQIDEVTRRIISWHRADPA
jgi:hypothetical protein